MSSVFIRSLQWGNRSSFVLSRGSEWPLHLWSVRNQRNSDESFCQKCSPLKK